MSYSGFQPPKIIYVFFLKGSHFSLKGTPTLPDLASSVHPTHKMLFRIAFASVLVRTAFASALAHTAFVSVPAHTAVVFVFLLVAAVLVSALVHTAAVESVLARTSAQKECPIKTFIAK